MNEIFALRLSGWFLYLFFKSLRQFVFRSLPLKGLDPFDLFYPHQGFEEQLPPFVPFSGLQPGGSCCGAAPSAPGGSPTMDLGRGPAGG